MVKIWTAENINILASMIENPSAPSGDSGNKIGRRLRSYAAELHCDENPSPTTEQPVQRWLSTVQAPAKRWVAVRNPEHGHSWEKARYIPATEEWQRSDGKTLTPAPTLWCDVPDLTSGDAAPSPAPTEQPGHSLSEPMRRAANRNGLDVNAVAYLNQGADALDQTKRDSLAMQSNYATEAGVRMDAESKLERAERDLAAEKESYEESLRCERERASKLQQQLDDAKADLLRRHNDAIDRWEFIQAHGLMPEYKQEYPQRPALTEKETGRE